jgi:PKD repeat protein
MAGIQLAWDQTSSSSGPRDFQLQWSTNGSVFTAINAYTVQANVSNQFRVFWNSSVYEPADHFTNNLSSITALDNQSAVYFRFVDNSTTAANGGSVGTAGTDRMDNFVVASAAAASIQISGGVAWIPGGSTAGQPNAAKGFLLTTNVTVFAGMVVNVTNAPVVNSGTPSFFAALASLNGSVDDASVPDYQLTAKAADAANTNYVLGARTTGESGAPFVYGTTGLSYGTSYRVIIRTDPAGTNTIVYVNPTNAVLGNQTPYLTAVGGAGITPATSLGSFVLTQSKNGSLATAGVGVGRACAGSDYALVYYFLLGITPPVASFSAVPTSGAEPLNVTFTDTSTGTISNRFWSFGDTGTTNITTNSVSHVYAAGVYNVSLIASGPAGVSTNTQPNYITALNAFQIWQLQYFGSTSGTAASNADPDGDGQNNMAEFLSGTDPTNGVSALQITSVSQQGSDVFVTWTMGNGKTNALQFSAGVAGGGYSTNFADLFIATNTVGSATNFLDVGGATNSPSRYYRVRLVP